MGGGSSTARPSMPDCLRASGVVGCWAEDGATGLVVADPAVAKLYGIPYPDLDNGDPLERYAEGVHPADRAAFMIAVATASRRGAPFAAHYRVRTSAGVRFVHDYGAFTLDAAGRPLRGQGIVIDVTHQHTEIEAYQEVAAHGMPSEVVREQVALLAEHVIAASEITRLFPSARLRSLTDPLLWEVGRLLAWSNQE